MNGDASIVRLNVGGVLYQTTRSTIERYPYFTRLCECLTDPVFIDRDPAHFRYILNFMRGATMMPDRKHIIAELWVEADYYMLSDYAIQLSRAMSTERDPLERLIHAVERLHDQLTYMR